MKTSDRRVRWVAGDAIHLTLVFLGATPREAIPSIVGTIQRVASQTAPIEVALGAVGAFGRRNDTILWIGLSDGVPEVAALAHRLHDALREVLHRALPTEAAESTPSFRPHVTLARRADRSVRAVAAAALAPLGGAGWNADRLELVHSRLGSGPPVHSTLASFPLSGTPRP